MPYLIDGHNLIPKLGLSLSSIDDELELMERLQEFSRLSRKKVEVFFDGGQPGQARQRKFGTVSARFVRMGTPADEAIKGRLKKLGKAARNWTVVSSDHEVQQAAVRVYAGILSSEAFARLMENTSAASPTTEAQPQDLLPEEVDEWLEIFRSGGDHKDQIG